MALNHECAWLEIRLKPKTPLAFDQRAQRVRAIPQRQIGSGAKPFSISQRHSRPLIGGRESETKANPHGVAGVAGCVLSAGRG